MSRNITKAIPYVIVAIVGFGIFFGAIYIANEDLKGLLINIAASLIAIPSIFIAYDLVQSIIQKSLNQTLFDYAKMKSDKEIITIISQVMKIVYSYSKYELSPSSIQRFLSLTDEQLRQHLGEKEYFGFQIFKQWNESEKYFESILQNPLVIKIFGDAQIITIVDVIKSIGLLDHVFHNANIFIPLNSSPEGFKVVAGSEISVHNAGLPNRHILLRTLDNDKYVVADFGDFLPPDKEKLLKLYKLDARFIEALADDIHCLIKTINKWFLLTGKEMIFDPRQLRARPRPVKNTD